MTTAEPDHNSRETPRLTLWPHRSLSPRAFKIMMMVLGGMMLSMGLVFFLIGAWPVIGFMGLEIAVLWMAFKLNYKAAKRRENLSATSTTFRIERVSPEGQTEVDELPSPWLKARLEPNTPPEDNLRVQQKLIVSSHGKQAEVGSFLHASEKQDLLPEIEDMLKRVQR
ncbi:MAG: DUF2244 domain-containing protein [Alphaproteobacteria bacterium]|nr:DUF2244 domain-containing protein [Alphaproteobacteria bacterium]